MSNLNTTNQHPEKIHVIPGYAIGSPMFNLIISWPSDSSLVAGTTTSRIAYSIVDALEETGIIKLLPFYKLHHIVP